MAEWMDPAESPPPVKRNEWARTVLWVSIVLILVGAGLFMFKSCVEAPVKIIRQASDGLATVAAAFHRGTVSNAFVSYATTLTNQLHLQVATLSEMELFTRQEAPVTGFGYIPLPDVVVEARAPVQYTYYLDLNAEWRFVLQDRSIQVYAPPIRFNKPAVDASTITYEVRQGVMKTAEALGNLKRSISSLVTLRARDNLPLVRETARQQTIQFVQTWLMRTFTDGKDFSVQVRFAGEPEDRRTQPEGLPGP